MSESTPSSNPPTAADDATLIDWLRDRDAACPLCGYNLRALQSPRCPECGQILCLSIALAEPYLKAWITLLVFSCLGCGVGLMFVYIIAMSGFPRSERFALQFGVTIFSASTPLPLIVLLSRRKFLRMARQTQWVWAALISAIISAGFFSLALSWR